MATGEICKLALKWGLLQCSGKTPEATMASSLYGDIKRNDGASLFFRPTGGMFGLREWREQGFFPPLSEATPASTAQQEITASPIHQKGKRQRKNASDSKQSSATNKRQHRTAPPPQPDAGKVVTSAGNLEMQGSKTNCGGTNIPIEQAAVVKNTLQQNDSTDKSNNCILSSRRPAMTGTLTAEQPRKRLLNSESIESPWTSACNKLVRTSSLPNSTVTAPAHTATQGEDWFRAALTEQENKVAAVENKWGPLHPRAGQAHLLLYKAFKQQCSQSVESRAQTALTR